MKDKGNTVNVWDVRCAYVEFFPMRKWQKHVAWLLPASITNECPSLANRVVVQWLEFNWRAFYVKWFGKSFDSGVLGARARGRDAIERLLLAHAIHFFSYQIKTHSYRFTHHHHCHQPHGDLDFDFSLGGCVSHTWFNTAPSIEKNILCIHLASLPEYMKHFHNDRKLMNDDARDDDDDVGVK